MLDRPGARSSPRSTEQPGRLLFGVPVSAASATAGGFFQDLARRVVSSAGRRSMAGL